MASTLNTQVLMNKGKRAAAASIYAECSNPSLDAGDPQHLNELLDVLLNPGKPIDDRDTIDWCKWLIASGCTPDVFANTVRVYDNATTCGLVWTPNFVAYRCRTCSISPCMSLCTECFKKGNHFRHDFNMFLSQAGGACDCGDPSVMKESGFCDRHGPKAAVAKPAPSYLLCVAVAMMPRLILRLIQHLRENCKVRTADYRVAIKNADGYLTMLLDFNKMGTLMRQVMTAAFTDPQKYRCFMDPSISTGQPEYDNYCVDSNNIYQTAVRSMPNPEPLDDYKECAPLQEHLEHTTFLEELMFWTVDYEFPQNLVCLLLNMLPDPNYKEALTCAFVLHYSRVSMMLERSTDPDTLSNRIVHVSVQLFSNETLALRMVDQLNLLHVMVISLKYMMTKILIQNTLHNPHKNLHYVVDCRRQVMKEHCYWPLVSDLNNVLSHKAVADRFMSDDTLLELWFNFLSMFQGMNVNELELSGHIEFEPNTYYAAFSAELEASAYPMWALASHLSGPESAAHSRRALSYCLMALQDWLDAINYTYPNDCGSMQVSFHLPLHRYFAVFMCQAVRQQGATLNNLLPPTDMLHLLMMHPLRVQVAFYEIWNGLWVRNGLQIKGQAMTYIQCNFCNSMVDADLYLLQVCATKLQPDVFIKTVIENFHVQEWMSLCLYRSNEFTEGEKSSTLMLESCLTFLATLMNVRTNLGLSDNAMSGLEMVTLLCMGDKTHSQLMELMPERCGTPQNRNFESILAETAQYKAPNLEASGNMQQGMYGPKPYVWDELFDPLHVLLRAVHRKDFQISMDRFTEYVTLSGKLKSSTTPWPPFRHPAPVSFNYDDPRLVLRTKVFHAMILIILYKTVYGHNISEHVMALTIYLLEMAVITAEITDKSTNHICHYSSKGTSSVIKDMDLDSFYKTNNLSENLRTVVPRVFRFPESDSDSSDSEQYDSQDIAALILLHDGTEESCFETLRLPSLPSLPALPAADELHMTIVPEDEIVAVSDVNSEEDIITTQRTLPPYTGETISLAHEPPPSPNTHVHMTIVPEDEIVAVSDVNNEDEIITTQRVLPPYTEETISLVREPPPSPNNMISGRPALPPVPQRPAVLAGNEIVAAQRVYPSLSSSAMSVEIVPSTSTSHKHLKRREPVLKRAHSEIVEIGDSIISLLLRLHSQLSGVPDSYSLEQCTMSDNEPSSSSATPPKESRIGDGPFFISQLLNKIANLDPSCKEAIIEAKNKLWPPTQACEDEQREKERREKEERRKRAKERQQKVMAEFANKQKQFWEKALKTDEGDGICSMDGIEEDNTNTLTSKKEYDCVICNQTTPTSDDAPMGLIVLIQPTCVLGHALQQSERPVLPTSDEDPPIATGDTRSAHWARRMQKINPHFAYVTWVLTVDWLREDGVHVQTCGHHLHLDCLHSYLQSLRHHQRPQNIAVERGEYLCPLCRQLANSVLPLSPQLGECEVTVPSRSASTSAIYSELNNMLKEITQSPPSTNLSLAMVKSMEDMTKTCTSYKDGYYTPLFPSPQNLFFFITSIARTNFEIELIQRGGSLCVQSPTTIPQTPKRDCLVALLHVLARHARILASWPVNPIWLQLTGMPAEPASSLALRPQQKEVPLLLIHPTVLLIQFTLLLPLHLDLTYYSTMVQVLYNLLYYQVILQISCDLTHAERITILRRGPRSRMSTDAILYRIIEYFNDSRLYCSDDAYKPSTSTSTSFTRVKMRNIEQQIQTLCLPFLRVAALLRYHLYEQPLPLVSTPRTEFVRLVYYLELVSEGMDWDVFNSTVAMNWSSAEASYSIPRQWCEQFLMFVKITYNMRYLVMEQHISWQTPKLLSLPREYEKLFSYYRERKCRQCHSVPREISICLICGTIVCLKQGCCKQKNVCEAVQHSAICGTGTGIYLVVTSTYIVVIRGRRACLWGSLYLDDFEEEDKDLKRGKPLYLSQDRYQLLEQQWLTHRFDHTKKAWVWHRDAL